MKHLNLKKMLTLTIMVGTAMCASAQDTYQRTDFKPDWGIYRGAPVIGDYNNDGNIDFYVGGQNWNNPYGWFSWGYLYTNQGNGVFKTDFSNLYTDNQQPVSGLADTDPVTYVPGGMNADGTFRAHGLPVTTKSYGYFFDSDNDGNLDFLIFGGSDYDVKVNTDCGGYYTWLYRNGGAATDYTFTLKDDKTFPWGNNERDNELTDHSVSFADYNHDGNIDVLIQNYAHWKEGDEVKGGRSTKLFRGNGDGTFTEAKVFTPIAYSSNPHPGTIFNIDETTFEATPTMTMKQMSGGATQFGDLNNDGYVDIVSLGYADDGGAVFYVYKNNGDGTFQEMDTSKQPFIGVMNCDMNLTDMDGDGLLDIVTTGTSGDWTGECQVYLNQGDFNFNMIANAKGTDLNAGLYGARSGDILTMDINHDGLADIMETGYSGAESGSYTRIFFQTTAHEFTLQNPNAKESSDHSWNCWDDGAGGFAVADFYGTNNLDYIETGLLRYKGTGDGSEFGPFLYKNTNTGNTAPTVPVDVKAEITDNVLDITWGAATDNECQPSALTYNISVQDNTTGKIFQLIPADTKTGHLKVYHDIQTGVHGDGVNYEYKMTVPSGSDFTVGVQAIDPSWVGGPFAFSTVTGINNISATNAKATVSVRQDGICATSSKLQPVYVFNTSGMKIAQGKTNELVKVSTTGVLLVKIGNQCERVIK